MFQLTEVERKNFVTAASAYIGSKERTELIAEQATQELGHRPSSIKVPDGVVEPAKHLVETMGQLLRDRGVLPPLSFRGYLFSLNLNGSQVVGATILKESEIVTVE